MYHKKQKLARRWYRLQTSVLILVGDVVQHGEHQRVRESLLFPRSYSFVGQTNRTLQMFT